MFPDAQLRHILFAATIMRETTPIAPTYRIIWHPDDKLLAQDEPYFLSRFILWDPPNRLASKVACFAARGQARKLFKGHQYGVATPAGAERVIHLCRKTFAEHTDDDDFLLCKIDLKNAFNNVTTNGRSG